MRSSALGRDLLRNGMAAFLVFQAWGNNPRAYADPNTVEHKALVDIAHLFVDEAGEWLVKGPVPARATALEHRFDIQNLDTPPPAADERMPWHFRYDGAAFEILALDTRTRRSYEPDADPTIGQPFTLEANAALLTDEALREQIPEEPPTGNELSVVVAAVPVLGYPPVESLVQPVLNIYDIAKQPDKGRFARLKAPDRRGRVNYDPEPWGYVPRLHAALLDRLSSRSRVVFLSGDVHYSATLEMSYWKRRQPTELETTRFVQLTGSSFRARQPIAQPEHFSIDLLQIISRELSRQHELLGWHLGPTGTAEGATPLAEPADGHFNDRTRYLMTIDPILVSPAGLPAGTQVIRDFEWASRLNLVIDPRPDEERLEGLTPPPLRPTQADDVTTMVQSAADRVVWHVENAPDRTWMWWSNATIVDFLDTPPRVRHSIYTFDLASPMPGARPYLIATVGLDVNPTEQPPAVP